MEAGLPSGTFSTADEALAANRDVLVVPGAITAASSRGANRLIYQGATPVIDDETFEDALFSLFGCLKQETVPSVERTGAPRADEPSNPVADALRAALPEARAAQEVRALTAAGPPHAQRRQTQHALAVLVQAAAPGAEDKEPVAVRAKRIIDENFADPMMGLYLVSEQLNVSNSYLSTTFKATYGVSIIQYINRLRVDQAKSLILNTDMNIKDIAQTVGFSSDINFIRVFKKLENRTPTTLRRESRP